MDTIFISALIVALIVAFVVVRLTLELLVDEDDDEIWKDGGSDEG